MGLNQQERRDSFLKEFNNFYDAVLRRIQVRFAPSEALSRVYLTLSVCRPATRRNDGWVNVRLAIKGVDEIVLRESPRESCQVLSSGLQIGLFDQRLFFDFAPYSMSPRGLGDYRRSGFYVVGRSFSWKVEAYSELLPKTRKGA